MTGRDRGELLLLGAIWGASFLFMRVAVPELGALSLIAIRVGVAAVVLALALRLHGGFAPLRGRWRDLALLGAINTALPFCLFAHATCALPAGFSSVLNATVPLFGALVAFLGLHERLPARKVVGLCLGFLGVLLLAWPKLGAISQRTAILEGLAAALCYGIAAHFARRRFVGVPSLAVATGSTIAAEIEVLPIALFALPAATPSARSLACAAVLGVACTGLAYVLYFRLLARIGAARATTVTYLIPLFGIAWGVLFLDEPFTLWMACSGAVVLSGTALVVGVGAAPPSTAGAAAR